MSSIANNDNARHESEVMRIYIFRSDSNRALRAFTSDIVGEQLPQQFGPWLQMGTVAPSQALPHGFERDRVEQSIKDSGFQMWRLKAK